MDYLNPLGNNLAYALAVEKLLAVEVPDRATTARVILAELTRIGSHLVGLGTQAIELGAQSVFLYCFREREQILDIFEMCFGQRLMCSYIRPGGLAMDLPPGFETAVHRLLDILPARIDEYEALLTNNGIWRERTIGVGILKYADAVRYSIT